jgi:hypothetical protein
VRIKKDGGVAKVASATPPDFKKYRRVIAISFYLF